MIIKCLKPITIIGIMGAGKTKFAKKLSQKLNLPSIDLDEAITKEHKNVTELLNESKEKFQKIELEMLQKIINEKNKKYIISTGDTLINNMEALNYINSNSICIWLNPPLKTIFSRLKPSSNRPFFKEEFTFQDFCKLFNQRKHLYAKAHIEITKINYSSTISKSSAKQLQIA